MDTSFPEQIIFYLKSYKPLSPVPIDGDSYLPGLIIDDLSNERAAL